MKMKSGEILSRTFTRYARTLVALAVFCVSQAHAQTLEEVIVTAQKREQNAQDVGVALTVVRADELRASSAVHTDDIAALVPNLGINHTTGRTQLTFTMRGAGNGESGFQPNHASTVGIVVDDAAYGVSAFGDFQLFDLERVEVLFGPQGTLFGRNNTGGTVSFVSRRPTSGQNGFISAEAGRYDALRLEGAVEGAFSDALQARAAATLGRRDGYVFNRLTGEETGAIDRAAGRVWLRWTPSEAVGVDMKVHGGYDRSDMYPYQHIAVGGPDCNTDVRPGGTPDQRLCVGDVGYSDRDNDIYAGDWNRDRDVDTDAWGGSVRLDWDLAGGTFTSITAYDRLDQLRLEDEDGSPDTLLHVDYSDDLMQFTQELRFQRVATDDLLWLAGLYYSTEEFHLRRTSALDDIAPIFGLPKDNMFLDAEIENQSYSVFGQVEWRVAERLKLIVGARSVWDDSDYFLTADTAALFITDTPGQGLEESWTGWMGKLSAEWTPVPDMLAYLGVSRGYKAGGFPTGITASIPAGTAVAYDPEFVDSWEAGFKSTLGSGQLRFNGAVFYMDYQDKQEYAAVTGPAGVPIQVFTNAAGAEIYGAEIELLWEATDQLELMASLGYLDTEYTEFRTVGALDLTGNVLPNTPELSAAARAKYQWPLAKGAAFVAAIDASYQEEIYFSGRQNPLEAAESYTLLNGRVAWTSPLSTWELSAYIKNATDKEYRTQAFLLIGSSYSVIYGNPRTYGVGVTYRWAKR